MTRAWEQAVRAGDLAALRQMLDDGADIDARDQHGQTALMRAAHDGRLEVVRLLIARGAALNVAAKYHLTALMLAVIAGHSEVARTLVEAGADVTLRGSGTPGFAGRTARDLAAARGDGDLARLLE